MYLSIYNTYLKGQETVCGLLRLFFRKLTGRGTTLLMNLALTSPILWLGQGIDSAIFTQMAFSQPHKCLPHLSSTHSGPGGSTHVWIFKRTNTNLNECLLYSFTHLNTRSVPWRLSCCWFRHCDSM